MMSRMVFQKLHIGLVYLKANPIVVKPCPFDDSGDINPQEEEDVILYKIEEVNSDASLSYQKMKTEQSANSQNQK